ncbi:hypothetical protein BDV59DRAFT_178131 [Aspergillus ambiguus]|uniref:fungal specific transcription factor domain-containing protein n=1 Tax=Aspergillus ambiguus TaxID=176160 RepID=UPI003CCE15B2
MAQQALFHDTDREFSTAAYRVEAATILRRCLLVGADRPSQEAVDLLDTSITSWFHRLPASMRGTLHYTGEVNEMAFQAQMIMHCASIYLHFPQSYLLTFLPKSSALLCARPPNLVLPSVNSHLHSSKVLNAAISLSKLASLSTSTVGHSPFFVCTLVISSTIQLAMLSIEQQRASNIWHYLSLNIGTIKSLAGTWRIAANSTERIRSVVTEVKGALEGGSVQPVDEIA